jgi:hypothetical protein
LTAEKEREKCNDRRENGREALEKVKRKLPLNLEVEVLSPKSTKSTLSEAEDLCLLLRKKDQDMLLRLLSARDTAKRDWLQSFLGGEL